MSNHTSSTAQSPVDVDPALFRSLKNTGFSELSTRGSQDSHKSIKGESNEAHMSKAAFEVNPDAFQTFLDNATNLKGKVNLPLSAVIFKDLLPALVRKLKGMGYRTSDVDSLTVRQIVDQWYSMLVLKAEAAKMDTKNSLPYVEEVSMRLAEMFKTTVFAERDWVWLTHRLIESRKMYVLGETGSCYPPELQHLEVELVRRDVYLNSTEAAAVLLCWTIACEYGDGILFVSERCIAKWAAELAGRTLENDNHARVVGRATIQKLKRLGIITEHERGKSYKETGRADAKATSYRWAWGQPVDQPS